MANDPHKKEIDHISGVETTGHEWDGLKELNNPSPRWWLWVFFLCVIWAVGYWVVYPTWPTLSDHTRGLFGWTQHNQLKEQQAEIMARQEAYAGRFDQTPLSDIGKDPGLFEFARAGGAVAFKNHCAACHGTGGAGAKGYPNLNDDDWLWGGTLEQIYTTIRYGVRSGHEQAHDNAMPAFGRDGLLTAEEVGKLVAYVGVLHDPAKAAADEHAPARQLFADNCVACHAEGGVGNQEMGAPRLNDQIWLYGGDQASLLDTITNARSGVMPYWEGKLDPRTIKQLAIYVHALGGGQ